MGRVLGNRPRTRVALALAVGVLAFGYLGYHAVNGNHGLAAWFQVSQRIVQLENLFQLNQTRIERLDRAVSLLRAASLDRDMLDERARHILGLAHPDEMIILR